MNQVYKNLRHVSSTNLQVLMGNAKALSGGLSHWFVFTNVAIDVIVGVPVVISLVIFVMVVYGRIQREVVPPHMFRRTLFLPMLFSALIWLQFHASMFAKVVHLSLRTFTPRTITSALIGAAVAIWIANLFAGGGGNRER